MGVGVFPTQVSSLHLLLANILRKSSSSEETGDNVTAVGTAGSEAQNSVGRGEGSVAGRKKKSSGKNDKIIFNPSQLSGNYEIGAATRVML